RVTTAPGSSRTMVKTTHSVARILRRLKKFVVNKSKRCAAQNKMRKRSMNSNDERGDIMEERMNLAATWEHDEQTQTMPLEENTQPATRNSVTTLRELVLRLLCEVQSINE